MGRGFEDLIDEGQSALVDGWDFSWFDGRATEAVSAGLDVVRLTASSQPMTFDDVAAIVVFLRKVIWIVPGFTVDRFLPRLRAVHDRASERFLVQCRKP